MKSTVPAIPLSKLKNNYRGIPVSITRYLVFFSFLFLFFFCHSVQAQNCPNKIDNNEIQVRPATCPGVVALLQGSTPTGGIGTYTYQWQMNPKNCGNDKDFENIPGETGPDLNVKSIDDKICYRRVVYSGGCVDIGKQENINRNDIAVPLPPFVTVTQPTCTVTTGTITVTNPAPGNGNSYSINGIDYSNTTGRFTNLDPKSYSVTVKYRSGCISPAAQVIINAPPAAPTGIISPASVSICNGISTPLTVNGGTSYQWFRDGVAITGATAATYNATQAGTYTADIISGTCIGKSSNSSVVTVDPTPSGTISPATATVCAGTPVPLTVTGGTSYQWYKDGIALNGATSANYTATTTGVYTADIINSAGCKAKASNQSVVTVNPLPLGTITPANADLCTGGSVTLTATGGISYQWYKDGKAIIDATSASYIATLEGTYSVEINNGTCKANASNNVVVRMFAAPVGTISPATATLCPGSNITLSATGGTSYQWYKDGTAINGATGATYSATASGRYSADIISGICKSKASNEAVINAGINPNGSITPATATICGNGSQVLTATGGGTYQWLFNGQNISGATGANYTATQAGIYSVLISNGSCSAPATNVSTINQLPIPIGTVTPAAASICSGGSQVLTVNGGTFYQWYKDGVAVGATSSTYTATQAGSYTAVIFNGTCSAPATNVATITLAPTPIGTISPASASICSGSSQILTVNGGTSYQWYKDGIAITGATTSTFTVTQSGTYTADVIAGICKSKTTNSSVITVTQTPTGTISPATATLCTGESVLLTATGGASYQWYKNGAIITGAINASLSVTQEGTYTADIISTGGCKGKASNSGVVTVTALPSGTLTPANLTLCPGGSGTLTVSGGTSYQWYNNGIAIPGITSASYTVTTAGTYTADIINGTCKAKASNSSVVLIGTSPSGTINPATGSLCAGGSLVLTVGGGTTYQWYKNGVAISGATSSTYTATATGTYTADIISGTCSGKATNEAVITSGTIPSGSITPSTASICSGGNQVLTTSGGTSYQWLLNGQNISGATGANYTATQPGTYSVTIFNGTCSAPAGNTATITQAPSPTGSISPASAAICSGGSQVLTATGGSSYQWYRDGVLINGATSAGYTATQTGTFTADIINGTCKGKTANSSVITTAATPTGTISPAAATLCTGSSITLTATGGTTYQWYKDGFAISGATSASYSATQAGTYTVDIINGTCTGKASNSAVIASGTAPSGNITPATATICTGASVLLTATGGSSYQWYKDGTVISGATSATYTATGAGTYSTDIINGTCKAKASNNTVVFAGTTPTVAISPATASICTGGTVTLTTGGGITYQWYKDGIAISGAISATYNATDKGMYTADIINGSCTSKASNSSIVSVIPTPSGSINPSTGVICTGSSIILTASGGTAYQWYKDGVAINGATAATYSATASGTFSADIISGACKGKAINEAVITTAAVPAGSISPASATLCSGGSQLLTATGGTSYQWERNGTLIPGATSATYTATQLGTYSVILRNGTCTGPASNTVVIAQGTVPTGTITPASAEICSGEVTSFTATGGTSYQWYKDGILINGATAAILSATEAGIYTADIVNNNGCKGKASNSAVLTITTLPSGAVSPANLTICSGGSGTLTVSGGTAYQWFRDGVAITGATAATYNATLAGNYTADIISGTCKTKATNSAVVIIGISPVGTISPATATLCSGSSQVLTVTGGSSYQWFKDGIAIPNATAATYTVTAAGIYSADIISGNCKGKASNSAVITAGTLLTGTITPAAVSICSGNSTTLSVTGGSSYQWYKDGVAINGATGSTFIATTAGNYTADILAGTCTGKAANNSIVTISTAPSGSISPASANLCSGGSSILTASGGTTYQWYKDGSIINGATAATYTATQTGVYTADIISSGGCKGKSANAANITVAPIPTGSISPATVAFCAGSSATVTANGGTSYQWYKDGVAISGATSATYSITAAGIYTADIINGSCSGKAANNAVATVAPLPSGTITPATGTFCTGGSIVLTASGGTLYQWYRDGVLIPGATAATYTVTQAGSYTADVSNSAGCKTKTTNAAVITTAALPVGSITPTAIAICPGGSAALTATGGSTYQWYKDGILIPGATGATYTTTVAGTYTTDIISGSCKDKASNAAVVTQSALPAGVISPAAVTLCPGGSTLLSATGGTSYQWYKDGIAISGAISATYSVTQAGTYTADIINGTCKGKASNSAVISIGSSPVGVITPAAGALCSGGSLVLTVGGGTTYQWYKDGVEISGATAATYTVTAAGTYSADISSGTCKGKASNNVVITTGTAPTGTISPAAVAICTGTSTILSVSGGTSYQWYRDGVLINGATAATYSATVAGTYTADILAGNCTGKAANSAEVTLTAPPSGSISPAAATLCTGGAVALTASGGSAYQWYKDGVQINGATAATYTATQIGVYTADVISSTGCKSKAANEATITLAAAPTGIITPATLAICPGGSATATVSGGTSYQWYKDGVAISGATQNTYTITTAGTYSADIISGSCKGKASNEVTATISNTITGEITPGASTICSGGSATLTASGGSSYQWYKDGTVIAGATTATYTATEAGNYTADIINGTCKGKVTNTAIVTIGAAPTGTISPATASICSGNSTTLTASGGTSYQWALNGTIITGAVAATYNATQPGTYSVTIINGTCSGPASNTAIVSNSTAITFTTAATEPTCIITTGSITITNPVGGTGSGYQYSKDNGITFQSQNIFRDLSPGNYRIVVKDDAGCTSAPSPITITQGASTLSATAASADISCVQTSGTAKINASGGTAPYTYSINGGAFGTSSEFNNLTAGVQKVTVKDAVGCVYDVSFTVNQVASTLAATAKTTDAGCGQTTGTVTITPTGGTQDYQYSIDGGAYQGGATLSNVAVGQHKATVKDKAGCTFEVAFEIKQIQSGTIPNLVITNPPNICAGSAASLQLPTVTAGSEAGLTYTYWRDAAATSALANPDAVAAGTYYIKATNQGGCFAIKPVTVGINLVSAGGISPAVAPTTTCRGGTITLTATQGSAYQWYRNDVLIPGATANTYGATEDGIYSVYINNGTCIGKASNTVAIKFVDCSPVVSDTKVFVPKAFTPNSNGANDVLRPILYNIRTLTYFKVYNRWGQAVFQTSVIGSGWDGTIKGLRQPAETYTWILECIDNDGKIIKQSGRSLLLR